MKRATGLCSRNASRSRLARRRRCATGAVVSVSGAFHNFAVSFVRSRMREAPSGRFDRADGRIRGEASASVLDRETLEKDETRERDPDEPQPCRTSGVSERFAEPMPRLRLARRSRDTSVPHAKAVVSARSVQAVETRPTQAPARPSLGRPVCHKSASRVVARARRHRPTFRLLHRNLAGVEREWLGRHLIGSANGARRRSWALRTHTVRIASSPRRACGTHQASSSRAHSRSVGLGW